MPEFESSEPLVVAPSGCDAIPMSAAVPILPGTYANLEALAAHCNRCQRCELGRTRQHAAVSRGNPQAKLMIIGEGPGQREDETGLPFVGPAGQLLDRILASVGLNSETDAFIVNVIKCRPPGNRVPTSGEMAACRGYLLEQVRLVDPTLILLAGSTAVKGVLGVSTGITRLRGQWHEWQGRPCLPVFHPSYLLRNESQAQGSPRWWMWQDIRAVRAKLDALGGP